MCCGCDRDRAVASERLMKEGEAEADSSPGDTAPRDITRTLRWRRGAPWTEPLRVRAGFPGRAAWTGGGPGGSRRVRTEAGGGEGDRMGTMGTRTARSSAPACQAWVPPGSSAKRAPHSPPPGPQDMACDTPARVHSQPCDLFSTRQMTS